jgi:hypothetical protein
LRLFPASAGVRCWSGSLCAFSDCGCSSSPTTPCVACCLSIGSPSAQVFEAGCVELALGLGESLARPCRISIGYARWRSSPRWRRCCCGPNAIWSAK